MANLIYFCSKVVDVYAGLKNNLIRAELRDSIITPALDAAYYSASHWNIDGEDVDLILDALPENGESDALIDKISPELALEYIKAQRLHCAVAQRFEYAATHPVKIEDSVSDSPSMREFKRHINAMKEKLDAASALLEIAAIWHDDEIEPYNEKLTAIVHKIYNNILDDANEPSAESGPVEASADDFADDVTELEPDAVEETAPEAEAEIEADAEEPAAETEAEAEPVPEAEEPRTDPMVPVEEAAEDDGFVPIDESESAPNPESSEEAPSVEDFIAQHVNVDGGVPLSDGSSITIN